MAAIAERPADQLTPKSASDCVEPIALPPGSVPVDPVRSAMRPYRAGIGTEDELISAVDRHGDALEREIARIVDQTVPTQRSRARAMGATFARYCAVARC